MDNVFEKLNAINVSEHTEDKNGLTYLSWAWAWAEFKKIYPEATYEVMKFDGLPYVYDENTGYMCYTKVTVGDLTHEMWLPVMDGANKAMKNKPYTYKTKYGEKSVEAATMFDINKTIMRCLTKNLAMFGLGLYIYAGEDLPEEESAENVKEQPKKTVNATAKQIQFIEKLDIDFDKLCDYYKVGSLNELTIEQASEIIQKKGKRNGNNN